MNSSIEESLAPEVTVPANSRKPRILYIVTRAERGGAQTHVLDLASSLQREFEVEVATGEEGFLSDACRQRGIPLHILPHLQREVEPITDAVALWEVMKLMKRVKPDLIHAHTFKAGFLGRLAGRMIGIPSVYTIHAWLYGTPAVSKLCSALSGPCERLAARWCESIIAVSDAGARLIREKGIGRSLQVRTIHNGIPDMPSRVQRRREQPTVITMVSRFIQGKDHETLLRAFAAIKSNARLRLVGDGPTRSEIERLAQELDIAHKVEFAGDRSDVPDILADSDVFVLASKSEMLPISILEAMRAGLPVVASDVGGVSEAVTEGETGFLVPSGSASELAKALEMLSADASLRRRMGTAGRKSFEEKFASRRMEELTSALYWQVLSPRDLSVRHAEQTESLSAALA